MPEQQPPQLLTEADLSARLHHLATPSTAPVPTTGAHLRSRAVRRRRNRRAALSTTALGAAALITVTSGVLGSPAKPATPPATSVSRTPTMPVQRVTVDLDAYTLTIEGKTFRIGKPSPNCPIGETEATVTAKYPTLTFPRDKNFRYDDVVHRAVTFTDRNHHQRLLMFALIPEAGLNAIGTDFNSGAIALSPEDGKRVYDAIEPGARVEIKGHQGASVDLRTCAESRPITSNH